MFVRDANRRLGAAVEVEMSASMPSLKMTPFSGICDTNAIRSPCTMRPITISAPVVRLGIRLAYEIMQVIGIPGERAIADLRPSCASRSALSRGPARHRCCVSQPVEPRPVETMMPLDDCRSSLAADGDRVARRNMRSLADEEIVYRVQ